MNCNRYQYEMSMSLDGRLPSGRREVLMNHIANCDSCASLWDEIRSSADAAAAIIVNNSPELGSDDNVFAPSPDRLRDQFLVPAVTVMFCRVEEIEPALDGQIQRRQGLHRISRAERGDAHGHAAQADGRYLGSVRP